MTASPTSASPTTNNDSKNLSTELTELFEMQREGVFTNAEYKDYVWTLLGSVKPAVALKQLRELYRENCIGKQDYKDFVKSLMNQIHQESESPDNEKTPPRINKTGDIVEEALSTTKRYRESKSPETLMIRRIVSGPVVARFQMQCATPDSQLFGTVPPRRLNKTLFNIAIRDPLNRVFTRHAPELQRIPGEKVVGICKWKVRKMRGNLKNKDPKV